MPPGPAALPAMQLSLFEEPPSAPAPGPVATTVETSPAGSLHPRASRHITLDGQAVAYAFRRSRRRSIGFVIAADGLAVSAPRWVGMADIEGALREKAGWILRKLHEQRERARRVDAARVEWRDGTQLPFLGAPIQLRLDPLTSGAVLHAEGRALHLGLPASAAPPQIRDAVQSWLQRQARRIFEERCALFAPRLGVRMKRLSLSSAATRWGSASVDGSIRLNWRLVHFALPVIDYVVAHELAHLREMNHSPAFWDVVRTAVPDFEIARGALRHEVLPAYD
jgi:predicted metal-dependent hydrolase